MKIVRRASKPVSLCLVILMSVVFIPCQTLMAGMIGADTILDAGRLENARSTIRATLYREDVKNALMAQGIPVEEAMARIDSLTDAEVIALADRIDQLPAGGSAIGVIAVASVVVFVILLTTDILGYTDLFPFVKKHHM